MGGATNLVAQNQPAVEEVRWLRGRITGANVGVEAEGDSEQRTVSNSNQRQKLESFYAVPMLGLDLQGSVYHPNLLQFNLNAQNGVGWQETSTDVPGGGRRSDSLYLLRYHANADLLKEKPYSVSYFAEKEHTTRDYDFFTRAIVDQESQGGRIGYSSGPVPFSVSLRRSLEDISGQARPLRLEDNTLAFAAYHERASANRTDLSYTLDDSFRQEAGAYTQRGTQHTASLNDTESFGRKDWVRLNSALMYSQLDTATTPVQGGGNDRFNRYFTDHEHLNLRHTGQLQSDYNYSYNLQESGAIRSDGQAASAAVRHQLYESLHSAFDLHSQFNSITGSGTALDTTRYGLGLNESYTKRLGNSARFTLGYGGLLDQEHRTTQGQTQFIIGETHVLTDGLTTFLNQPLVDLLSIKVWNVASSIPYRELLDYVVIPHGERTEVKRVVGGQIPNGGTIRVDYSVASQPSDSYSTFANQFQVRFDFFQGLLGLYGRLNMQRNYGGKSLVLEEITDQVGGLEVTWRWLRAGAEYERFDSNLNPYRTARLFQNLTFEASSQATVGLDAAQSWSTFPLSNRDLTTHQVIARVRLRLNPALSLNTEGGLRFQQGEGYDQQLATARINLEFRSGKLAVLAGYDYENETYIGELRLRHFFSLRAKRSF